MLNLCWWLSHTEGAELWVYSSCVLLHSSTQHANHDQSREPQTVSIDIQVAARFSFLNGVLQIFNARLWARKISTSCFSHPHPAILSSGLKMAPNPIFSCVSRGWKVSEGWGFGLTAGLVWGAAATLTRSLTFRSYCLRNKHIISKRITHVTLIWR